MSKINIYETGWLNLVFEGRNKAYGAYQLRTENPKTTVKAFFSAMALLGTVAAIPVAISYLKPNNPTALVIPDTNDETIIPVDTDVFKKEDPIKEETGPEISKPLTDEKVIKHINMVVTEKEKATENVATNSELEKAQIGQANNEGTESTGNAIVTEPKTNTNGNGGNSSTIIEMPSSLEVQPQYPGGIGAFLKTVGKNFKTPEVDEGVKTLQVLVYFVIEKDGSLSNIRVTRDPGYSLGKEATRVLNNMKIKWSPGYKNGQPVRTAYNLPITINVEQ
jgi:protein TonB